MSTPNGVRDRIEIKQEDESVPESRDPPDRALAAESMVVDDAVWIPVFHARYYPLVRPYVWDFPFAPLDFLQPSAGTM